MSRALDRYLKAVLQEASLSTGDEAEVREELMEHLGFLVSEASKQSEEEVYAMLEREFGDPQEIGVRIASAKGRFRTYLKKEARQFPRNLVIALVIALLIRWQIVAVYAMASDSMAPVVSKGCHVVVNKLAYRFGDPRAGDLVLFEQQGKSHVGMVQEGSAGSSLRVSRMKPGQEEKAEVEMGRSALVGRVWLVTR